MFRCVLAPIFSRAKFFWPTPFFSWPVLATTAYVSKAVSAIYVDARRCVTYPI